MQSMFERLAPHVRAGQKIEQRAIYAPGLPQGVIAHRRGTA